VSRGPRSERALAAAEPVAWMRGEVMFLEQRPGTCFDFMVSGPAGNSAIRVERALCIHGSLTVIAARHAGTIDRICAAALAPEISRELWLWAPWGTMRYFRIDGTAITELDRLGVVRAPLVKGALAGTMRPRWKKSKKKSGSTGLPPAPGPERSPGTGPGPQQPGTPGTTGKSGREPAPVRYLRRRAAGIKRKKEGGAGVAAAGEQAPGSIASGEEDNLPS
jgi:hypothetical protein